MGIDPVTHKLLNNQTETLPQQEQKQPQQLLQDQQQHQQDSKVEVENEQNKELEKPEISVESSSTITELAKEEEHIMTPLFDSMELINEFCTEEVPIIKPDEILVPCVPSTSTSSYSSSSSASASASDSSNFLDDLLLPDFEWSHNHNDNLNNNNNINNNIENSSMVLWDDDDEFIRSWDFLMNDDDGDRKQVCDGSLNQFPKVMMDSESWAYGLF